MPLLRRLTEQPMRPSRCLMPPPLPLPQRSPAAASRRERLSALTLRCSSQTSVQRARLPLEFRPRHQCLWRQHSGEVPELDPSRRAQLLRVPRALLTRLSWRHCRQPIGPGVRHVRWSVRRGLLLPYDSNNRPAALPEGRILPCWKHWAAAVPIRDVLKLDAASRRFAVPDVPARQIVHDRLGGPPAVRCWVDAGGGGAKLVRLLSSWPVSECYRQHWMSHLPRGQVLEYRRLCAVQQLPCWPVQQSAWRHALLPVRGRHLQRGAGADSVHSVLARR